MRLPEYLDRLQEPCLDKGKLEKVLTNELRSVCVVEPICLRTAPINRF